MKSWIDIAADSDFSLSNLPYGIFSTPSLPPRIGIAVGCFVLDFTGICTLELFSSCDVDWTAFDHSSLNEYAALGSETHASVRVILQELLKLDTNYGSTLRDNEQNKTAYLLPSEKVTMHLPFRIGDYTDFFVGINHARNSNLILRGSASLLPSYLEQPIGYHGRASSIAVSGTAIQRPMGQVTVNDVPIFQPTEKLDYEVEFAAFIGQGNQQGQPIDVDNAENHIFGYVLMNDWSARDIQRREQFPLGPFNGKNFATTISPWVVTGAALCSFLTTPLERDRTLCKYLVQSSSETVYDIPVEVKLTRDSGQYLLATCNTKNVVFSFPQMIAHHTAGGCPLRPGDLLATGTLSGDKRDSLGCLLEATENGTRSIIADNMRSRQEVTWLETEISYNWVHLCDVKSLAPV